MFPLLRIGDGQIERALGDTDTTSGNIDATEFKSAHGMLQAHAFRATDEVVGLINGNLQIPAQQNRCLCSRVSPVSGLQ